MLLEDVAIKEKMQEFLLYFLLEEYCPVCVRYTAARIYIALKNINKND